MFFQAADASEDASADAAADINIRNVQLENFFLFYFIGL